MAPFRLPSCAAIALAMLATLAEAAERPNFVVLLCDDLGYGDLGCYGHPQIKSPRLDKLATEGIRFTECYAAAPVCSPSRAGLLTGRNPGRAGIYDWISNNHPMHLGANEVTIATLLKQAGYATCQIGKWHLNGKFNQADQPQPGDHGFQHWMSTQNNAGPSHANPRNFVRNGTPLGDQQGYSCDLVTAEAIRWLSDLRDKGKPFFLYVCYHETHEPVASPADLVAQYPDAKKPGEAEYYANVANVDRAIGRLLDKLDELKLSERTLVFFTSDNGPETLLRYASGKHCHGSPGALRGMKLHLYEGGIRVPGILRYPTRVKGGQTIDEPVCSLDFLPTFCELGGVKLPEGRPLDGASFTPLFDGQPIVRTTPLYWQYFRSIGEPKAALRVGDYVILGKWDGPQLPPGAGLAHGDCEIIKAAKLSGFELYNLKTDPGQKTDLAAAEPGKLKELSDLLVAKYQEVQKEGPVWKVPKPVGKEK
ncbi:MAG TPA: sulfatase-like hydrolase/transferase [Pirellulaceae bacterium]|nr:sulfatase-like hydrolase/transferase [Pirellulaceae bacterium]